MGGRGKKVKRPTNRPGESKKSSVLSRHPKIEANPRTFSEKKRRPEIPKEENSHVLLRKKKQGTSAAVMSDVLQ